MENRKLLSLRELRNMRQETIFYLERIAEERELNVEENVTLKRLRYTEVNNFIPYYEIEFLVITWNLYVSGVFN